MKIQVVSDRRLNQGFGLLCSLPLSLLLCVGAAVSAASTGAEVMESSAMAVRPFPLCENRHHYKRIRRENRARGPAI